MRWPPMCALIVVFASATCARALVTVTASASGVQKGGSLTFTATTDATDTVVKVTFTYQGTPDNDVDSSAPYQIAKAMDWATIQDLTVTATFDFLTIGDQQGTVDVDVVDIYLTGATQPLRGATTTYFAQTRPSGIRISSWSWSYDSTFPDIDWTDTSNSDDRSIWRGIMAVSGTVEVSATILGVACTNSSVISVRSRTGGVWVTPVDCVEDNEPNWGAALQGDGEVLGEFRDKDSNAARIITPQTIEDDWEDGVTLNEINDGPNDGLWYVRTNILEIDMETVINQFLKAGGPLPDPCASENWYSHNNATSACLDGEADDFVQANKNHEYRGTPATVKSLEGHFGRVESELDNTGDPAVEIEDLTAATETALLNSVNIEIGLIESALSVFSGSLHTIANGPNWGSGTGSLGSGGHTRFDVAGCAYYSGCTFGPDEF